MLTGEAKKIYQRNYMRKRRAVRPLDQLDQTLDNCRSGLITVNKNLEEVIKTMTDKSTELDKDLAALTKPTGNMEGDGVLTLENIEKARETMNNAFTHDSPAAASPEVSATESSPAEEPVSTKATIYCSTCNGRGFVELDRIGLVTGPCPDCKFPKKP